MYKTNISKKNIGGSKGAHSAQSPPPAPFASIFFRFLAPPSLREILDPPLKTAQSSIKAERIHSLQAATGG